MGQRCEEDAGFTSVYRPKIFPKTRLFLHETGHRPYEAEQKERRFENKATLQNTADRKQKQRVSSVARAPVPRRLFFLFFFFFLCALPRPQLVPKYFDTPKPNTEKVKPRLPHPGTQIFSKTCQDQRSPSKRPPSFFSFCQN